MTTLRARRWIGLLFALLLLTVVASLSLEPKGSSPASSASQTAAPSGVDQAKLEEAVGQIEAGRFGKVDSLLVFHSDELLLERYFNAFNAQTLHHMYSVTKSVTSLLVGIAMDQGHLHSVDQTLLSFFPEYNDVQNLDERKHAITLADLLTMRAGFQWDEHSTPYTHPDNPTTALFESADWMKFMLDVPMAHEPGAHFTYNSGVTMLLSGILKHVTGMNTKAFAEQFLFGPLGITEIEWGEGPGEIFNTGWGLFLRPQDMLKLGRMVLDGGIWEGQRIISQAWLDQSLHFYVVPSPQRGYGYQWWMLPKNRAHTIQDVWYADGWGGQHIFIVEDLDLVVVLTGSNYDGAPRSPTQILVDYIIPAVQAGASL